MLPTRFYLWSTRSFIIIIFSVPSSFSPTTPIPSMHLMLYIYTKPSCWYNEACTLIFVGYSLFLKYPLLLYLHKRFWLIDNSPEANKTVLELINEFGKVAGYKINIHKFISFLYTKANIRKKLGKQFKVQYLQK